MKSVHFLILLISLCFTSINAQKSTLSGKDDVLPKQNYEENITKEFINDVYIPQDLDEALEELKRLSESDGITKFKDAEEAVVAKKLHFGLGRWIMEKWNLYDGSRYSHYLRLKGLSYPDDMARFTIISLHRDLNGKNLEVDERIKEVRDQRTKEYKEKLAQKKVIKEIKKEDK